jgi:hypothetical protein
MVENGEDLQQEDSIYRLIALDVFFVAALTTTPSAPLIAAT